MEMTNPQKAERYIQNLRKVRALSKPQFSPETAPDVLLETDPEALIGVLDCETVEAVQSRREEILLTAYHCGLYHDVGKSAVIMYIDTNSRRLLDEELLCIQSHSEVGYCLLCDAGYDEYLAPAARFQDEGFCERLAQKLDQERKKVYLQVYHVGEEQ